MDWLTVLLVRRTRKRVFARDALRAFVILLSLTFAAVMGCGVAELVYAVTR